MRILLCHNFYQQPGGEDEVFRNEEWLLRSHGHEVETYTRHNDDIREMSNWSVAAKTMWNRTTRRELGALMERFRPQVMHCTNTFPLISPAAYYTARRYHVKVVQSVHNYRFACLNAIFLRDGSPCEACVGKAIAWPGIRHGCYRNSRLQSSVVAAHLTLHRWMRTWRRTVDQFIALTEFAKQKLVAAGVDAERITVKPNFVHPDPGPGKGTRGNAIFVGRLTEDKGVRVLLDCWKQHELPMTLTIVGGGPMEQDVRNAAAADPRIEFLGQLPFEQVLEQVGDAGCLIMPSIWYETFGRTMIEAFSRGTPVIASRMGAMSELVTPGRTGWLFEPGNSADLLAKLTEFHDSGADQQRMRVNARKEFEARYTAESNYEQLISVYQRVLASETIPCEFVT